MTAIITSHDSKPTNEMDRERVFGLMANALMGVHGFGDWDGGIGGDGWYIKRMMIWEAALVATITGDVTLTIPFEPNNTLLEVINNETQYLYSIESGRTVNITGLTGKIHVFVKPTRNKKG